MKGLSRIFHDFPKGPAGPARNAVLQGAPEGMHGEKKNPDRQIFFPDIFRVFYVDFIICVFPEAFADFQKKAKEAHASKYEAEVICRLTPSKWANTWGIECVDFKRSCCREVWNYIEFFKLCHSECHYIHMIHIHIT